MTKTFNILSIGDKYTSKPTTLEIAMWGNPEPLEVVVEAIPYLVYGWGLLRSIGLVTIYVPVKEYEHINEEAILKELNG